MRPFEPLPPLTFRPGKNVLMMPHLGRTRIGNPSPHHTYPLPDGLAVPDKKEGGGGRKGLLPWERKEEHMVKIEIKLVLILWPRSFLLLLSLSSSSSSSYY